MLRLTLTGRRVDAAEWVPVHLRAGVPEALTGRGRRAGPRRVGGPSPVRPARGGHRTDRRGDPMAEGLDPRATARRLLGHLDASPTPYHAVDRAAELLGRGRASSSGTSGRPGQPAMPDRWFVRRGGALVAAVWPSALPPEAPLRIVGAHTDSPNLRLKPRSAVVVRGLAAPGGRGLRRCPAQQLARPGPRPGRPGLGPAGRRGRAWCWSTSTAPVARIPQLAIHLDREVNQAGLVLNPQQHLLPLWAPDGEAGVLDAVAAAAACAGGRPDGLGPDAPRRPARRPDRARATSCWSVAAWTTWSAASSPSRPWPRRRRTPTPSAWSASSTTKRWARSRGPGPTASSSPG